MNAKLARNDRKLKSSLPAFSSRMPMKAPQRKRRRLVQTFALVLVALMFWTQEVMSQSGPPLPPPIPDGALSFWPLEELPWQNQRGQLARACTNLNMVSSWDYAGTVLSVGTNVPAWLQFDAFDNGRSNIVFDFGTISLWYQPNWTSTTDGGTGPTNWAVLLSVGDWTSDASQSAWTIAISPAGTNLAMEAQASGSNQVVFNVPIDFDAGDWHSVTVTYSSSNFCVYLEGQIVTTTGPINNFPSGSDCTNYGLFVGSVSTSGDYQCQGQLQWLATYVRALSPDAVADDYANVASYISYWGGSLPGTFSPDSGPPVPPGSFGGGGGPVWQFTNDAPPIGTNLWLYISQVSNTVAITLTNTVSNMNYLLLTATNLNGPWLTNQSLLATNHTAVAAPYWFPNSTPTFFIAEQAPPPPPGTLKWSSFLGGPGDGLANEFQPIDSIDASPAIGPDGTIYIPNTSNVLFAIDPISGNVKWSNNIVNTNGVFDTQPAEITGSATIGPDGTIYIGSTDNGTGSDSNLLYAFHPDGTMKWVDNLGSNTAVYSTPALGSNGMVYITIDESTDSYSSPYGGLLALNSTNGHTNWYFRPQDFIYGLEGDADGSPAVASDGTIYFLSEGHRLYAVSPSGNLKWFLPVAGDAEPDSTPAIASDGTIYVGSNSRYAYAVNPDGSLKWVLNLLLGEIYEARGDPYYGITPSSAGIDSNGNIYMGVVRADGYLGNFFAINPEGTTNWVFGDSLTAAFSSPAISGNGTIYFGSENGNIYAVSNGSMVWSYVTGGPIFSSPAISSNGTVYVASSDGYLYAFFGSAPLATNSPWPMFHQNAGHTALQSPPTTPAEDCGAPFVFDGTNDGAGNFTFSIVAGTSNAWNLYISSNLSNWTLVYVDVPLTHSVDSYNWNISLMDSSVGGVPQRFYRLVNSNNTCSSRTIGFVNLNIVPGTNLIADQLLQVDDYALVNSYNWGFFPVNTLNALFPPDLTGIPQSFAQSGTQIMTWNGQAFEVFTYGYNGVINETCWSDANEAFAGDATLLPGVGVLMVNSATNAFANTFVGLIREQQVFQIPASTNAQPTTNYLSPTVPMAGAITNITGYVPHVGDVIQVWNIGTHQFDSCTNTSSGWTTNPVVSVGEGFVLITTNASTWTNTWQP
jgi:outer membrane protein assembly factor BamB